MPDPRPPAAPGPAARSAVAERAPGRAPALGPPATGGSTARRRAAAVGGPAGGLPPRDRQRARVYRAENAWAARLDAARLGAPLATVAGSRVLLPGERRLGSLAAAASYARSVLSLPAVREQFGPLPEPVLRRRRGSAAAHWEPPGTIALPVPSHGEPWALRETVLLHELAHHVGHTAGLASGHGAPYPAVLLALVTAVLGEEAALALRVDYGSERVEVGAL